MMDGEVKVTYFKIAGRAEPIRLALFIGEVPFHDEYVTGDEWASRKGETPFGQLPVLTYQGQVLAQSQAILRFVGKHVGLYPEDPWSAAKVDEVIALFSEVESIISASRFETDEEKRLAMRRTMAEVHLPPKFDMIEKILEKNESGFLVGSSLTIADLLLVVGMMRGITSGAFDGIPTTILDNYSHMQALKAKIHAMDKVREWMKAHPDWYPAAS
mmetsp:Transcript_14375/g.29431  ORF Transcript_14375/g.29431 Transcript_14375/m.29431 type:complete len:215 (-) Transcript_14375:145-789(-)